MPVRIQLRRGSANDWSNNSSVILEPGEIGLELNTGKFKVGDGSQNWSQLPYSSLPSNAIYDGSFTAKGMILSASGPSTPVGVTVGNNNTVLVADSSQTAGIRWASTLSGLTLTSPTINTPTVSAPTVTGTATIASIASGTTISAPVITGGAATSTTLTTPVVTSPLETWAISPTAVTGVVAVNVKSATNWYHTANAVADWTFNFRGDAGTTLNSMLAVGQSATVGVVIPNGATAYRPTAVQVDGSAQTVRWQGNIAPTAGNPNGMDAYVFTVLKINATPTYVVFGAQTKFA